MNPASAGTRFAGVKNKYRDCRDGRRREMDSGLELVDFLGGPLDGYQRTMTPEMLVQLVEFDISENTFRIMAKDKPRSRAKCTSTAIYLLGSREESAKYHFLAVTPPHQDKPPRPTLAEVVRAALRRVINVRTTV
jgi:hypothetical protein